MRLSAGPMILLVLGLVGIGWALWHAATGDDRCADQCEQAGYTESRYTAPLAGHKSKCQCVADDGTLVPAP